MSKGTPPNISTIKYTIERIILNYMNGEFAIVITTQHIVEYLNSLLIHDYAISHFSPGKFSIAIKLTKKSTFVMLPFTWSPS